MLPVDSKGKKESLGVIQITTKLKLYMNYPDRRLGLVGISIHTKKDNILPKIKKS